MYVENLFLGEGFEVFIDLEILVEWSGFFDKESRVEKYYFCVGIQFGECNIMNFIDLGNVFSYIL